MPGWGNGQFKGGEVNGFTDTGAEVRREPPVIGQLLDCPGCAQPAEVLDTFTLPSTHGPAPHVRIGCVARHYFMMPAF
jgi:hypothetical protein